MSQAGLKQSRAKSPAQASKGSRERGKGPGRWKRANGSLPRGRKKKKSPVDWSTGWRVDTRHPRVRVRVWVFGTRHPPGKHPNPHPPPVLPTLTEGKFVIS